MLRAYAIVLSFLCLMFSCTEPDLDVPLDYSSAVQLQEGNYWVYKTKSRNLLNGAESEQLDDSVFVSKDTVIDNKVFYIIENLFGLREIKTTALGEIIDLDGNVEFSGKNFVDTLYRDEESNLYGMMKASEEIITVPAGKFKTVMFIVLQRNLPGHVHEVDPANPAIYNKDYLVLRRVWYAKNVGIVKTALYFNASVAVERSLVRYNLN